MTKAPSHVMTPGRAITLGTIPARPRPRCGTARGSVSGVCPEASRRHAGGSSPYRSDVSCLRTLRVSSLNLAGRPNAERCSDRPALVGEHDHVSAAAFSPCACAERRRLRLCALRAAGRRHFLHHPRCDIADVLPFVSAHRAPPKSALRPLRQELRRCASEAPSPDAPPICRNQIGSKGSPRCRTFSPRSRRSSPRAVA